MEWRILGLKGFSVTEKAKIGLLSFYGLDFIIVRNYIKRDS